MTRRYEARIGQMVVAADHPYVVYGSVRGLVSAHRTLAAAQRTLARDEAACARQGGYSDAYIYHWSGDGWVVEAGRKLTDF